MTNTTAQEIFSAKHANEAGRKASLRAAKLEGKAEVSDMVLDMVKANPALLETMTTVQLRQLHEILSYAYDAHSERHAIVMTLIGRGEDPFID